MNDEFHLKHSTWGTYNSPTYNLAATLHWVTLALFYVARSRLIVLTSLKTLGIVITSFRIAVADV